VALRPGNRRYRRWVAGIVATGVLPALVYIAVTGIDRDDTLAEPTATVTSQVPAEPPTTTPQPAQPEQTQTAEATPEAASADALAVLPTLPVKGRAPKTGYDRDQFGPAWLDVDGNGCDTRNDILARDLTDTAVDADGCIVRSGLLADPYSRTWIRFVRGENTSEAVQIDHVVSLSDAWQKGAQQLTVAERERLANDPLNLLAVDGALNQQKSDGDAATWLPPNKAFRCEMVARQVAVKARYNLWVTGAERDAIERVLAGCPDQGLPSAQARPTVRPDGAPPAPGDPASSGAGEGTGEAASSTPDRAFANCSEAREAGAAPVRRGEPGYGPHLDGDGDGIACE
jgi:hypothetical protein